MEAFTRPSAAQQRAADSIQPGGSFPPSTRATALVEHEQSAGGVSPKDMWEQIKPTFIQLYQKHTLKETRSLLQGHPHYFEASERQYKERIQDWGVRKYLRDAELEWIEDPQNYHQHAILSNGSPLEYDGRVVTQSKLDRRRRERQKKRRKAGIEQLGGTYIPALKDQPIDSREPTDDDLADELSSWNDIDTAFGFEVPVQQPQVSQGESQRPDLPDWVLAPWAPIVVEKALGGVTQEEHQPFEEGEKPLYEPHNTSLANLGELTDTLFGHDSPSALIQPLSAAGQSTPNPQSAEQRLSDIAKLLLDHNRSQKQCNATTLYTVSDYGPSLETFELFESGLNAFRSIPMKSTTNRHKVLHMIGYLLALGSVDPDTVINLLEEAMKEHSSDWKKTDLRETVLRPFVDVKGRLEVLLCRRAVAILGIAQWLREKIDKQSFDGPPVSVGDWGLQRMDTEVDQRISIQDLFFSSIPFQPGDVDEVISSYTRPERGIPLRLTIWQTIWRNINELNAGYIHWRKRVGGAAKVDALAMKDFLLNETSGVPFQQTDTLEHRDEVQKVISSAERVLQMTHDSSSSSSRSSSTPPSRVM